MREDNYFDYMTMMRFYKTLIAVKGVSTQMADDIVNEIINNGFLIRERAKGN